MSTQDDVDEYRVELKASLCSRCIEQRAGAPPCAPRGKGCGIERHLPVLVAICRTSDSRLIDPYIEKLHDSICTDCEYKDTSACPPLLGRLKRAYFLPFLVMILASGGIVAW